MHQLLQKQVKNSVSTYHAKTKLKKFSWRRWKKRFLSTYQPLLKWVQSKQSKFVGSGSIAITVKLPKFWCLRKSSHSNLWAVLYLRTRKRSSRSVKIVAQWLATSQAKSSMTYFYNLWRSFVIASIATKSLTLCPVATSPSRKVWKSVWKRTLVRPVQFFIGATRSTTKLSSSTLTFWSKLESTWCRPFSMRCTKTWTAKMSRSKSLMKCLLRLSKYATSKAVEWQRIRTRPTSGSKHSRASFLSSKKYSYLCNLQATTAAWMNHLTQAWMNEKISNDSSTRATNDSFSRWASTSTWTKLSRS